MSDRWHHQVVHLPLPQLVDTYEDDLVELIRGEGAYGAAQEAFELYKAIARVDEEMYRNLEEYQDTQFFQNLERAIAHTDHLLRDLLTKILEDADDE